MINLFIYLF